MRLIKRFQCDLVEMQVLGIRKCLFEFTIIEEGYVNPPFRTDDVESTGRKVNKSRVYVDLDHFDSVLDYLFRAAKSEFIKNGKTKTKH